MSYTSIEGKQQGAARRLWPNRPEVRSAQKVRAKSDGSGVEIANVKMSMNRFDEIAIEVAVRLREEGVVIKGVALSSMPTRTPAVEILAGVCGCDVPRIKTFGHASRLSSIQATASRRKSESMTTSRRSAALCGSAMRRYWTMARAGLPLPEVAR